MTKLNTPIAFTIFNRPDTAQQVFNEIKKAQPKQLFVISDGPRNSDEKKVVEKTREIINQVDWDCKVHKNYSDKNLGCKIRMSSGIDWFFKNVEQGIILEDDCLPSQSFFFFCEELLNKYKDNEKIMMISGDNFQFGKNKVPYDYYFSKKFFHIWGWATWKRAWNKYDVKMKKWPEIKNSKFFEDLFTSQELKNRKEIFEKVYAGHIDTWDYQWVFTCMINKGLSIIPNENLISNIGFDERGTHTTSETAKVSKMKRYEIYPPIRHPEGIKFNHSADNYTPIATSKKKFTILNFLRACSKSHRNGKK